jgi:hypothetical protein
MTIDRGRAQSFEPLGSKQKFWFRKGDRRLLFKAKDRGTGDDWAERGEYNEIGGKGMRTVPACDQYG